MPQGVIAKSASEKSPASPQSPISSSPQSAISNQQSAIPNGNGASPQSAISNPQSAIPTKRFDLDSLERAGVNLKVDGNAGPSLSIRSEQFAKFQLDAPSCDNCGSITVRNGNCYLCHNCGNSMGCS
jgi:ribonucleoside-diphosphate reductase alpha chain